MGPWLSELFLSSQSDERLVSLASAGHDRAFAAIVARYRRQLHALARRLASDGRADDIVQQAFLSAFAALRSGAEVHHLRGWLHQILRNAAIRSAQAPVDAELDPTTISTAYLEDSLDERMLALSALSEVARLPERQRDAFVGTAIHGRSRAEVASSMGLSEGAVRQLVHRARSSVRGAVTAITPYPLAEWVTAARSVPGGDRVAEIAFGAGTASAGGISVKLGAVIVSGIVAAGVVGPQRQQGHSHRSAGTSSQAMVSAASLGPSGISPTASAAAGVAGRPRAGGVVALSAAPKPRGSGTASSAGAIAAQLAGGSAGRGSGRGSGGSGGSSAGNRQSDGGGEGAADGGGDDSAHGAPGAGAAPSDGPAGPSSAGSGGDGGSHGGDANAIQPPTAVNGAAPSGGESSSGGGGGAGGKDGGSGHGGSSGPVAAATSGSDGSSSSGDSSVSPSGSGSSDASSSGGDSGSHGSGPCTSGGGPGPSGH